MNTMKKTYKARDKPKKTHHGRNNKTEKGENTMGHRSKTNHSKDAKIYNKTANRTKRINVQSKPMRGGTRL